MPGLDQQATWLWQAGRLDEATTLFRRAHRDRGATGPERSHRCTRTVLAGTLNNLAILTATQGRHDEAAGEFLERAIAYQKDALKADPRMRPGADISGTSMRTSR